MEAMQGMAWRTIMVTILMAVYNGEAFLKEQLNSIIRQVNTQWRLIASDDGSDDRSLQILEDFAGSVENEVLIYTNDPPSGSAKNNFAKLMGKALDADYIMFSDQDDIWKEDKIQLSMDKMKLLEKKYGSGVPLLVHGDLEVINENRDVVARSMASYSDIRRQASLAQLLVQNNVTGCTMLINKALCHGIYRYISRDEVIMHDYFAAIYAQVFGKTIFIDKPLVSYRQHNSNSVGAKANKSPGYLKKRLSEGRAAYKKAMSRSYKQAGLFLEVYNDKIIRKAPGCYPYLKQYSMSGRMSHFKRTRFYFCARAWKKGIVRKVMQFLWG